jgi:glutamate racemase
VEAAVPAYGPIGVFDSGVGGLSVLRAIRRELPHEPLIYVADSGFAPYGDRDADFIEQRADAVVRFLVGEGARAVVVACNTATGVAVDGLRRRVALPIVAIEPAIKPAVVATRSGVIGVLATAATLTSTRFANLLDRHGSSVRVVVQPCPGLAERVELGDLTGAVTRALVERYVRPLTQQGADTLVVGCTHYAFLIPLIHDIAGAGVTIIDPADAVARELRRRLAVAGLPLSAGGSAVESFWSSGRLDRATRVLEQLWPAGGVPRALPEEFCAAPPTVFMPFLPGRS